MTAIDGRDENAMMKIDRILKDYREAGSVSALLAFCMLGRSQMLSGSTEVYAWL